MAPPRVMKAFHAMKEIGISEDVVKPVLKSLLRLYDKKWELIEEENYRALADAIFEYEETKAAELKNKSKNATQEDNLEEEAEVHDELERPLKRLRLRSRDGQGPSSIGNSSPTRTGALIIKPKAEVVEEPETCSLRQPMDTLELPQPDVGNRVPPPDLALSRLQTQEKEPFSAGLLAAQEGSEPSQRCATNEIQPGTTMSSEPDLLSSQVHRIDKGKKPISSENTSNEKRLITGRSHRTLQIREPVVDPGIVLLPRHNTPENQLSRPTNVRSNDVISNVEVPAPAICPEPFSEGASTVNNGSCTRADVREPQVPECNDVQNNVPEPQTSKCCDGLGNGSKSKALECSDGHDKGDLSNPASSSKKRTSCEFAVIQEGSPTNLDIASSSLGEERSLSIIPHVDSSKKFSAQDALSDRYDKENLQMPSCLENGSTTGDVVSQFRELPLSRNENRDCGEHDKELVENGYDRSRKEEKGTQYASLCSLVDPQQHQLTPHDLRLLHDVNDISRGEERIKIPWVNEVNGEHPPPFYYIPHNLVYKNAHVDFSLAQIEDHSCCATCFGNCLSSSVPCTCALKFGGEFAYTFGGLLKEVFLEECKGDSVTKIIKECWTKCGCHKKCGNRLVQRGISCHLQVFFTPEGKGWGLRTLEDLPKGAFVCEYVGEILTHTELRERKRTNSREKHSFTVLLDGLHDKEALCLDARHYGNVARFINHRCSDANLVEIPVQVETPDPHYYHLAFFTSRKVNASEELTWDYGVEFDDQNRSTKGFRCVCGSEFCRDTKPMNCPSWHWPIRVPACVVRKLDTGRRRRRRLRTVGNMYFCNFADQRTLQTGKFIAGQILRKIDP